MPTLSLSLLLACGPDMAPQDTGDLPADLAPLLKNTADYPADQAETLNLELGEESDYDWVHGKGYLHADLQSSWAAMQEPLVLLDRRKVSEWSVEWDTRPQYAVSHTTHNVVPDIVTIEFDMDWWQDEVSDGRVAGRYEKTEGTPFITSMAGGFLLIPISEEITAIEIIGTLDAAQRGPEPVAEYWTDVYADAVATVHGEDLPELD
ncbi:MAG: hypothetical protein VX899_23510 [Myxococcota bacterium]|nr:hypothetical protein [Myxococcota bacterium]